MREVDRLKEHVREVQDDLDRESKIKAQRKARGKEKRAFDRLPAETKHEFWCDHCLVDFAAPAYKVWSDILQEGVWISICPRCTSFVYRHATGKTLDAYYEKSTKVRVMRNEATIDMLRPSDYGFRSLYGDPFEEYYRRFQESEEQLADTYAAYGITGTTLERKREEQVIREVLEY